jgi:two-component system nitrate/nitrite sensor histidine kinase NarX
VRELLNNFRLKLAHASFQEVLNSVIERFKAQQATEVRLHYVTEGQDLSPQQQLQLVFIVQEALSNIRKHAQASEVLIAFSHQSDGINCSYGTTAWVLIPKSTKKNKAIT